MSIDYAGLVASLQQQNPEILAVVVVGQDNSVVYQTNNWDVSEEIGKITSGLRAGGGTQAIHLQGVKYSCFQAQADRLVAKNIGGQGAIVGAKTPNDEYVIGYISAEGAEHIMDGSAYMDISRCAEQMRTGGSYMDETAQMGKYDDAPAAGGGADDALKGEIEGFIQWIKQSDGFANYIDYYVNQAPDPAIISKLAKAYNDLRQIFNI